MLYNTESHSIRAAYATVHLIGAPTIYYPSYSRLGEGHALNVFRTIDEGLVFIDCTGINKDLNADKIRYVEIGKDYIPMSLFPSMESKSNWGNYRPGY